MPERLIGAVLKTVVRSRVPWVRIPPPPYKKQIDFSLICFLFWECVDERSHGITRHLKLKCLTLKIKNFKFASNLREDF